MPSKTKQRFQVGGPKALFVLVTCSLLWMINFMDRQVLSVVLEPMKNDLGLTDAQVGWITSSLFLGLAAGAIPVSYLVDRWSRKNAIGLMAIIWSLATLITGYRRNFWGVFLPCLITGAGQAGFSSAGLALIGTSYPEAVRARKMGFFNLFQMVGIFMGLSLGGYLSANYGDWRTPFLVFGISGSILGVFAFFMQDYPTVYIEHDARNKSGVLCNIRTLLKIKTLFWFYLGYAMFTATGFAILTWMPALVMRKFQIGEDFTGIIMAVASAFAIPGVILGGIWADQWQKKGRAGRLRFASVMVLVSTLSMLLSLFSAFFVDRASGFQITIRMVLGTIMFLVFCFASAAVNPPVMAASQTVVTRDLKGMVWGLGLSIILILGGGVVSGAYRLFVGLVWRRCKRARRCPNGAQFPRVRKLFVYPASCHSLPGRCAGR